MLMQMGTRSTMASAVSQPRTSTRSVALGHRLTSMMKMWNRFHQLFWSSTMRALMSRIGLRALTNALTRLRPAGARYGQNMVCNSSLHSGSIPTVEEDLGAIADAHSRSRHDHRDLCKNHQQAIVDMGSDRVHTNAVMVIGTAVDALQ